MAKSNGRGPPNSTRFDRLVGLYVQLRDEIDRIEDEHKKILEPYKQSKEDLITRLLHALDESGLESAKTAEGTVRSTVRFTAACSDAEAFMDYVREHDLYDLLDRRANALACRDHAKEHGTLPPGVKLSQHRSIGVTRS